jgi:hypothetical protein
MQSTLSSQDIAVQRFQELEERVRLLAEANRVLEAENTVLKATAKPQQSRSS